MMYESDYLAHYGVKGQKWGIRRYQNQDGSLTNEGRQHYGYDGDKTGRFNSIKKALRSTGERASSAIRKAASQKKDSFVSRHKPVSLMSEKELSDRTRRLQQEQNLKRLQDEAKGKNKQKKTFGQKHPVLQQVFVNTAVNTASSIVGQQLKVKADEVLAEKRMKRAKEKGMLDRDLFPFLSPATAGRNSAYNNLESTKAKNEENILERIKNAVAEERKTQQGNLERAASSAIRAAKAQDEKELREILSNVRSSIKKGRGSASGKREASKAIELILKNFENRRLKDTNS